MNHSHFLFLSSYQILSNSNLFLPPQSKLHTLLFSMQSTVIYAVFSDYVRTLLKYFLILHGLSKRPSLNGGSKTLGYLSLSHNFSHSST